MATETSTTLTTRNSRFEEVRDKLVRAIEVGDAYDERGEPLREEYYLSDSPGRAFAEHKSLIAQLYHASASTNPENGDVEQFWNSIRPRAQLLTILLSLHSVRADSKIWTDFIQLEEADRGSLVGLDDSLLPLDKDSLHSRLSSYDGRSPHQCPGLREDFSSRQLLVCAVKLEENKQKDRSAYSDKGSHLPLLQKILIGSGSSGKVYRVKFAPGHFPAYEGKELAMKQFPGNVTDTTYAREWQQSEKLHEIDLRHASVLTACAALKLEVGALLFFPLADFNLWQYMNTERPEGPKDYDEKLLWLHQLSRVAGALSFLHQENIHHGDVKSENILVTQGPSGLIELQLTDFGIMSGGDQPDGPRVLARSTKETPPRPNSLGDDCHNRAPESYGSGSTPTTRDMWGFGTVLSEVLAWFGLGKQSLDSFELKRAQGFDNDQYFYLYRRKKHMPWKHAIERFELRESVSKWFETHTANPFDPDTQYLHIRIWDLLRTILVCDQAKRAEADVVRQELLSLGAKKSDERPKRDRYSIPRKGTSMSSASTGYDPAVNVYEKLLQAHQGSDRDWSVSLVNDNEVNVISKCLDYAIRDCRFPLVNLLLGRLQDDSNVIHRAVETRNIGFLEQLATSSEESDPAICQDLNQPDAQGNYPLLMAISSPRDVKGVTDVRLELIRHLLKLGADVNISDTDGETPLHYASRLAVPTIVKVLLHAGAAVDAKDEADVTPLHLCASVVSSDVDRQPGECVRELLECRADRKARDGSGKFPLNYALSEKSFLEKERWEVIKVLCKDTLKEQYVFDVFNELPAHTKRSCIDIWHECNRAPT